MRYKAEEFPLDAAGEDEYFPVIFGTIGGNEHTKISNDGELRNTGSGSTQTKKSQRKQKGKSSRHKFSKMFASKEEQEEVSNYEEIKKEATSKLNSIYGEIYPTIEEHWPDNLDTVPTSVAEKWIEAKCSKYKADFDLYFSVIKNVMCPLPPTDVTAAGPYEGGSGPQSANTKVKHSEGGTVPQTANVEVTPFEDGTE